MSETFTLTVGLENADLNGNTNAVIQAAVDRVAAVGRGTVKILPGKYIMKDSLHLKSGVIIEGSGAETILWKTASIESPITLHLGYGHFDVSVADPDRFETGMGIRVSDDGSCGFYNTVGTIIGKQGSELIIDRMLNHDYSCGRNGRVVSVYPVVSGYYLENACISNLVIDGNASENEYIDGCRGGGIFLMQAHNVSISNITVRNYNGDAISFQQCINTAIEDCCCEDNTGTGLHPGSGSVGAVIRNVISRNNDGNGLFYCMRVSYTLVEGCTFEGNKLIGISIGHRDTDAIIRNNAIKYNGSYGIYFSKDDLNKSGCRTLITGNILDGNCRLDGKGEIYFDSSPEDVVIYNNEVNDQEPVKAADDSYLKGVSFDKPGVDMPIGPEFADYKAAYHLGAQGRRLFFLK